MSEVQDVEFRVQELVCRVYRAASLIRNTPLLGSYSRTSPRAIWWSWGGGLFLLSEVPLYFGGIIVRAW